ncbi:bifunctional diguanylate cyclase/phosphodiesterase [Ideonella dechloratans]|uniref:bifunctional diguanylate cyclase/phosphodiesterase n=1 Tax=Ideonella dechloratans TaxID=36863 RepID=UPI0035B05389
MLAALLVLAIAGYALKVSQDTYLQQGQMLVTGRADDFRQEVTTNLERITLAMRHVALANLRDATDPEARRRLIDESLREHMTLVPEVTHLRQTDANGVVRFQGAERSSLGQQLGQDPVFIQARGAHHDGLLMGEPQFDRAQGRWKLPLAYRVEDHAGRFQGIVIGELDLVYFDRMIDRRQLDPMDSLALRSTQLTLLSRQTGRDERAQPIGTRRIAPPFAEALKTAPLRGAFTARNVFDGVERITAYSTATPFPVMTLAGVSRDEVLRPWVAVAWRIGALAAVAALAVLASALLTLRAWRMQSDGTRRIDEAGRLTRVLLAAAADGVHVLDHEGRVVEMSDSFAEMLGWPREALLGQHVSTWDHSDSAEHLTERIRSFPLGQRQSFQTRHRRADGSLIDVEISRVALTIDGRWLLYCASRDITRRLELEAEQSAMLDNEVVGILRLREHQVVWANRAIYRMFGLPEEATLDAVAPRLVPEEMELPARLDAHRSDLLAGRPVRAQLQMHRLDGSPIWIDIQGTRLSADARDTLWVLADISALRRYQDEIEHLAMHDALTGLPNRRLLEDRLGQSLALSRRDGHALAVAYIDLDGFKGVNDRLGHAAGDLLLQDAARRILDGVREHDTVCRMGGDEFVLLLPVLKHEEEAEFIVQRVLQSLRRPYSLAAEGAVHVTASAGLALYPHDTHDGETLLRLADAALYQAKAAGRDQLNRWGLSEARQDQPGPEPQADTADRERPAGS